MGLGEEVSNDLRPRDLSLVASRELQVVISFRSSGAGCRFKVAVAARAKRAVIVEESVANGAGNWLSTDGAAPGLSGLPPKHPISAIVTYHGIRYIHR